MYKIGDRVIIKNSKDPYYRRRGTIIAIAYPQDWLIEFHTGYVACFYESELKPFVKKEKCCGLCVGRLKSCVCRKEMGCFDKVKKVSEPKEVPLTWDKPKCECGERIHLKLICTDFRFCNEDCYLKKQWRNEPMYTPQTFTITIKLKVTADTKDLAKAKVRRYLDRQMLEGSVE